MAGAVTAAKRKATQARAAEPALLEKVTVLAKKSKNTVSLLGGTVRVLYWESILGDTVKASIVFTDAGNTMTANKQTKRGTRKSKKKVSAVEGLPITGGEQVDLKFTDNNGNSVNFGKGGNNLFINNRRDIPTKSQTSGKTYELILTSKEFIDNANSQVGHCSAEQLDIQVKNILKDVLKSEKVKDENFEETKNSMNYIGNNKKAFYTINNLATKSVSAKDQELGVSAGYFFWETADGYYFKSIDTLLSGEQKKSIIYNESADNKIPKGYDIKALTLETDSLIDVEQKKSLGATKTKSVKIDPFTTQYEVTTLDAFTFEGDLELAGKELPPDNKIFDTKPSRTTFWFATTGQQHMGESEEQIEKSKEENFKKSEVVNQAIMRYNQLFAFQITITIPGEFSLHAGDCVYMDIPEVSESENKACGDDVNKMDGGLYIIADLCHYITAKETYTKLNLIRDSVGRTGTPTKGNDKVSKVMSSNFLTNIK